MGKVFYSGDGIVVKQLEQQIDTFFADVLKEEYMYIREPWIIKNKHKKFKKLIDELKR